MKLTPEQHALLERDRAAKKLERSNAQKVLRRLAKKLAAIGFTRKSSWFSRERGFLAQFIHIHKYSFGPAFRLHYCIRVLNEQRDSIVLSGPSETRGFDYGTDADSLDQCAEMMYAFVASEVEKWFEEQTNDNLLRDDSCLYPEQRSALERAVNGQIDHNAVQRSRELLGLKPPS